jgi:hypothetical protein
MSDKERSEKDKKLDKAIRMITLMVANNRFGELHFIIENGIIVLVREEIKHKL